MDASEEPAKRSHQPILLEMAGSSSQSKGQTLVSVSAATVATEVSISSSIAA
jgi:hypothetical protein